MLRKFFHHLFNPHCVQCETCKSCETLKAQLEISIGEKQMLLHSMLNIVKPNVVPTTVTTQTPVAAFVPFARRQAMKEAEDRAAAKSRRMQEESLQTITALEKELGVVLDDSSELDAAKTSNA